MPVCSTCYFPPVGVAQPTESLSLADVGRLLCQAEIADMTFGQDVREITAALRERLQSKGSNWRYCYKALNIIEYLVANGSERCIGEARDMLYDIRALERFQYVDREGKDQGVNIRERSKKIVELLNDNDRIYAERDKARANKNKFRGVEGGGGGS